MGFSTIIAKMFVKVTNLILLPSNVYIEIVKPNYITGKTRSFLTIQQKPTEYRYVWVDIDTHDQYVIDRVCELLAKFKIDENYMCEKQDGEKMEDWACNTRRGVHIATRRRYRNDAVTMLSKKLAEAGACPDFMSFMGGYSSPINEDGTFHPGFRITPSRETMDMEKTTKWRISDPFYIHLMNIGMAISKLVTPKQK
ncbi:MAG: hypothetical protein GY861_20725 [bacterium]|nr:hypothetical protein [bacterium]